MRFKICILALIGMIWFVSGSLAQPGPPDKEQRLAHLKDVLELTAEQTEKVSVILDTIQQKLDQLRNSPSTDRHERWETMRKIMEQEDARIERILNETQKKKYDQLKQECHKNHPGRGPGGPEEKSEEFRK